MKTSLKIKWKQIIIRDEKALPGKSVCEIINLMSVFFKFEYIILNDINGAAEAIVELENDEHKILKLIEVLKKIQKVEQFDWGDFFLFLKYPEDWVFQNDGINYPQLIAQTNTTVRAIDDTYLYIYTPYDKILEEVEKKYKIESIKIDYLENLDYPY